MAHRERNGPRGHAVDGAPAARVVLDTNAWLDVLVFRDSRIAALSTALESRQLLPLLDARALDELERVLGYGVLAVDAASRAAVLARARALSVPVATTTEVPVLPRCRDPDDQKFLELAVAGDASLLLTRDAELLRLAARMQHGFGVQVMTPAAWCDRR